MCFPTYMSDNREQFANIKFHDFPGPVPKFHDFPGRESKLSNSVTFQVFQDRYGHLTITGTLVQSRIILTQSCEWP